MTTERTPVATAFLAAALLFSSAATAQGLYLGPHSGPPVQISHPVLVNPRTPRPALIRLSRMNVVAQLTDGVATTQVEQVFLNEGNRPGEATWIQPLPVGATADNFEMTVNGVTTHGEVLGADKARHIYEDIVRRRRDPGLLEYIGHGCLRARIFPVPPKGEIVVRARYRQILPATAGLHRWMFPLRATGGAAAKQLNLDVKIHSSKPIKNVYSPLPGVDIQQTGDHDARLSMESATGQLPERDLSVFYGLSEQAFGLNLLTYRVAQDPGYFLMMLAPKQEWPEPENTRKVITFVLDTSGSMQGNKIVQARDALRFFLQSLRPRDLFNVIPFSTEARPFFESPVTATADNLDAALAKVGAIEARGGTNIEDALRSALAPDLPSAEGINYVPIHVFLTDGLPTVGTTDIDPLLAGIAKQNRHAARIFVFGVGNDVNSRLLDKIAADSRGDRDYVRNDENIEVKTSALFDKLSHPVMTNAEIVCDGIKGFDMLPRETPDLFRGSRLIIAGRYTGSGSHAIRLKGNVNGKAVEFVYEGNFSSSATPDLDFVPVLWAERKIAVLLDAIRLSGNKPELVDEVTRLGVKFGIVTPFTSHLVIEEGMRVSRARGLSTTGTRYFFGDDRRADSMRLVHELRRAGALTATVDAPPAAAQAEQVASASEESKKEASSARERLGRISTDLVGKAAVNNSVGLHLAQTRATPLTHGYTGGDGAGAQLFHRRVGDRTFYLAGGVWVDGRYNPQMKEQTRVVAAFSDDYFALLHEHPELAPYFAFSARIVVVLDGLTVEVE